MVAIGEMTQTGQIYQFTPVINSTGGATDGWTAYPMTARGRLRRLTGRKVFEAGQEVLNKRWEWICYYFLGIITPSNPDGHEYKWVIDGKNFLIEDYELLEDDNRKFIRFILKEKHLGLD